MIAEFFCGVAVLTTPQGPPHVGQVYYVLISFDRDFAREIQQINNKPRGYFIFETIGETSDKEGILGNGNHKNRVLN